LCSVDTNTAAQKPCCETACSAGLRDSPWAHAGAGGELRAQLLEWMEARAEQPSQDADSAWACPTSHAITNPCGIPHSAVAEPPLVMCKMENHEAPSLCPTGVGTWNL